VDKLSVVETRINILELDVPPPPEKKKRITLSNFQVAASESDGVTAGLPVTTSTAAQSSFPFIFDPAKEILVLGGGEPLRVFKDSKGNPWFQVKPLVVFLEYGESHVTHTLNRLDADDVQSLAQLHQETAVNMVKGDTINPLYQLNQGYHDLKALYVNEPGIYDLILGSQKEEVRVFKRWVSHVVLPALRRQQVSSSSTTRSIKLELEFARVETELQDCLQERAVRCEEFDARRKEARVRIEKADVEICTAQAAREAAQQTLEETRQRRRLAEADAKHQLQLLEARQDVQLKAEVQTGAITVEAAALLQPRRQAVRLENYAERCLNTSLVKYKRALAFAKKTVTGLAQELGKNAKAELLNKTRFFGKPRGDVDGARVMWYEEDCPDLCEVMEVILKAWTAPPQGQASLLFRPQTSSASSLH
jgi:prophage antirepressor-like protein